MGVRDKLARRPLLEAGFQILSSPWRESSKRILQLPDLMAVSVVVAASFLDASRETWGNQIE